MSTTHSANALADGQEMLKSGRFQEAADLLGPVVQSQPMNTAALRTLSFALISLQRFDEALDPCQRVAALLPQDGEARYGLGFILVSSGKFKEALPELDAALNIMPHHVPARQALVFALMKCATHGITEDPREIEGYLDRAHKLDRNNVDAIASLLSHYHDTHQRAKAVNLIRELANEHKAHAKVQPVIQRIEADPEFQALLQRAPVQTGPRMPTPASPPPSAAAKDVPCPNCKRPIMEWAAICPHCGFRNRDVGNFQGRDRNIPTHTWQDICYNIFAVLWLVQAIYTVVIGFVGGTGLNDPFTMWNVTIGTASAFVAIGLLLQWEAIMFIAKILLYLNVLGYGISLMIAMMTGKLVPSLVNAVALAIVCLMIYLIGYEGG